MDRDSQAGMDGGPGWDEYAVHVAPRQRGEQSEIETLCENVFGLARERSSIQLLASTRVPRRGLVFICGVSGAGKSTLLREILASDGTIKTLPELDLERSPLGSLEGMGFASAVSWLSGFGLGEPRLLRNPARTLSEGQKFRLRLAMLLASRPRRILIDEFLSLLDRTTARVVAYRFQRICRRFGTDAYVASAHDDLVEALAPDHVIRIGIGGTSTTTSGPDAASARLSELEGARVEEGTLSDYRALARYHHASDEEDDVTDWIGRLRQVAVVRHDDEPIAAVVSITPLPRALDVVPLFREINARVLYRFRTVVHPIFRGAGLTELAQPLEVPGVVAVHSFTTLGLYFPFHVRSGYRAYEHPRMKRLPEYEELAEIVSAQGETALADLNSPSVASAFWNAAARETRSKMRSLIAPIVGYNEGEMCRLLCEFAGFGREYSGCGPQFQDFFARVVRETPEEEMSPLLSASLYTPVQGFVKYLDERRDSFAA